MKCLAHRGFWTDVAEKNAVVAFERAFRGGYGIETDIRDLDGTLVVSHDPPRAGCLTVTALLDIYVAHGRPGALALNIKADGLQAPLKALLRDHDCDDYFVFDMSVPDSLGYFAAGMTVFTRRSEYEVRSPLDDKAAGVWFDAFQPGFSAPDDVLAVLAEGKKVALVSPELHRRDHRAAWDSWRAALRQAPNVSADAIMLCTDFPDQAHDFFAGLMESAR